MGAEFKYSWQSRFDENSGDVPVTAALNALDKFREGKDLTLDEDGLVKAAFGCRPDLLQQAGIELKEISNAA